MKKFLILAVAVGAVIFTGCSSEHTTEHIKSYKISFMPDKELSKEECFSASGEFMTYDNDIVGELINEKEPTRYINGNLKSKTQEVVIYVLDSENHFIANAGGDLNDISGGGDWVGVDCYGKWTAQREDK